MNGSVLVTGAYGLLGGWLVKGLLDHDARVVVVRRDEPACSGLVLMGLEGSASVVHGDITDDGLVERIVAEYEIDTVFHLAAQTLVPTANRHPVSTFETNIRGTWLLLEACRHAGVVRRDETWQDPREVCKPVTIAPTPSSRTRRSTPCSRATHTTSPRRPPISWLGPTGTRLGCRWR